MVCFYLDVLNYVFKVSLTVASVTGSFFQIHSSQISHQYHIVGWFRLQHSIC